VVNHEESRSESPVHPSPEVSDLSAERVDGQTTDRWAGILRQRGPVAIEGDKYGDGSSHFVAPPAIARRTGCLRLEEGGSPADSLEAQFQPVDDPSDPASTETSMRRCCIRICPCMWTDIIEFLGEGGGVPQANKGLKVGKAPPLKHTSSRVLKHLHKLVRAFLTNVFKVVLHKQYLPGARLLTRLVSTLKAGKGPALSSS
jgi:hypothetical protein